MSSRGLASFASRLTVLKSVRKPVQLCGLPAKAAGKPMAFKAEIRLLKQTIILFGPGSPGRPWEASSGQEESARVLNESEIPAKARSRCRRSGGALGKADQAGPRRHSLSSSRIEPRRPVATLMVPRRGGGGRPLVPPDPPVAAQTNAAQRILGKPRLWTCTKGKLVDAGAAQAVPLRPGQLCRLRRPKDHLQRPPKK